MEQYNPFPLPNECSCCQAPIYYAAWFSLQINLQLVEISTLKPVIWPLKCYWTLHTCTCGGARREGQSLRIRWMSSIEKPGCSEIQSKGRGNPSKQFWSNMKRKLPRCQLCRNLIMLIEFVMPFHSNTAWCLLALVKELRMGGSVEVRGVPVDTCCRQRPLLHKMHATCNFFICKTCAKH